MLGATSDHLGEGDAAEGRSGHRMMERRIFLGVIAGGLLAAPLAAHAQKPALPVIGFLGSSTAEAWASYVAGFRQGLSETGYVEAATSRSNSAGQRTGPIGWGCSRLIWSAVSGRDRHKRWNGSRACGQGQDPDYPRRFRDGGRPVKFGLVASLNRPGGNLTGVSFLFNVLVTKRLQVLHELVPTASVIGVLVNPNNPNAVSDTKNVEAAARALRLQTRIVTARPRVTSMRLSPASSSRGSPHCLSSPTCSLLVGAISWLGWRPATHCPRFTIGASWFPPAV